MDAEDAELCRHMFGLSDWAITQIPQLGRGQAIWQTGRHTNLVQTLTTDVEARHCFTSKRRDAAQQKTPSQGAVELDKWRWAMPPNVIDLTGTA